MKLKDYKEKKMQDPQFAKAYEEIQPEMNVIRAIIEARTSQNLTEGTVGENRNRPDRNQSVGEWNQESKH